MNTEEISILANSLGERVYVCSINQLNDILKIRGVKYIIIYTEPDHVSHGHWVLMYKSKKTLYLFDSLARDISFYNFKVKYTIVQVCNIAVQPAHSVKCGHFVLFFLYFLINGRSVDSVIEVLYNYQNIDSAIVNINHTFLYRTAKTKNTLWC